MSPRIQRALLLSILLGVPMALAAEEIAPQARTVLERYLQLPFPEKDPFGNARIVRVNTLDELKPFSDLAVREIARTLPGVTDPRQRMELAEALRLFQTRESAAKLSELLGDPNEKVRWQAIVGLGMMAGRVVRLGAQSVQRGGGVAPKVEGLVPQLIKAAGDENPGNRTAALSALADTLDPAAIAEIRRRLKDENAEVRFEAACLLTGFQDASGLGELQKALARLRSEPESNLLVMIRTERLLVSFERITGKSFGPIPMEPWASSQSGAEEEAKPLYKQLLDAWAAWWAWEPTAK
ncbi:MAG TPA: HEAT repeat domain-containing protein [Vicinamibacteria bacterium]|nr:HEAT repeat domain-containing protein [Vicinamibacteria bacterium]